MVAGVIRTIRRGRTDTRLGPLPTPAEPLTDVDDLIAEAEAADAAEAEAADAADAEGATDADAADDDAADASDTPEASDGKARDDV
ncbi:hypothetical protein GCM10025876_19740 [Demequina litorisediminis]|uniref:Uncharacterized protein n=1 Tax=Demequina litorisediminis TaxID=1849022 RepID=A0ABQ6ID88_9MICO|nr:hypothetical protein GCM10025876_19740 [Demequina litorisediminis]